LIDGDFVILVGGNVDQITELRKRRESRFAMAQANEGAAGANAAAATTAVPQVDRAAVADGERNRAAVQAAAPVAGPPVAAPVAVALLPQGLVQGRFDVGGALLGPLPTKSNGSCKILPKIVSETWP